MPLPKHTPYLDGQGGVKIGLSPIPESTWLELDNKFEEEILLKKNLLNSNRDEVLQISEGSEDQQEEIHEYFMEAETDKIQEALDKFDGDYDEEELRLMRIKFISDVAN